MRVPGRVQLVLLVLVVGIVAFRDASPVYGQSPLIPSVQPPEVELAAPDLAATVSSQADFHATGGRVPGDVLPNIRPAFGTPGLPYASVAVVPPEAKSPVLPSPQDALPAPTQTIIDSETFKHVSHGHDHKGLIDSLHHDDNYGLKTLFDSLHPEGAKGKHWYEKLSVRGYTQFRFARTVGQDPNGAEPILLGDRSINGNAENFFIRRARFVLFGDVSEHLGVYAQPDFAVTPTGSPNNTFFGQLRDLYGDVYIDTTKIHRFRVGLSKVPFGFENLQSSQNRVPLDRTDPINSAVAPNERDLGVFYYWTPEDKQKLFKELVDGGLKGSGNFGVFGIGVYNGQGGSQLEQNLNLHSVVRATWPFRLPSGQVVEISGQAYTGEYVVEGAPIRPFGVGPETTPAGTRASGDRNGHLDQRIGGTFVWYPQPFGFQTEWNVGQGPGLNDAQTAVITRPLQGGYAMMMFKHDTKNCGIFTPYGRYQYYDGGYRSIANAPYGTHSQWDLGVEWQIRKEMELTFEYSLVDGIDLAAVNKSGVMPYKNFDGGVARLQFQINY